MIKKQSMAKNAVILAVFSIVAKVISALYRIPLTNLLGAEGMGMYQLIYSIFALILAFSTGGLPLAISRLVAEYNAMQKDTKPIIKWAIVGVLIFSLIMSALLIFLRQEIAILQGNESISLGYILIIPSIILVGLLSAYRGYFQGNLNVYPTAISQLLEQIIKLICGLLFAKLLLNYGLIYGVYGALLGVGLSEFIAFIYIFITYIFVRKKNGINNDFVSTKDTIKSLLKTSVMFAICGFIVPFSQFIDGILIINILKYTGLSSKIATTLYGLYSGTVLSIINVPVVLTMSLTVALIPVISQSREKHNISDIIYKSSTSIKFSYVIGLPCFILVFIYALPIVKFLYPKLDANQLYISSRLLRLSSCTILTSSWREIYASLLMALDKTNVVLKNNIFAIVLKTAVLSLSLLYGGIDGVCWALISFGVVSAFLNVKSFNNLIGKNHKLLKNISTILLSSGIMSVATALMYGAINDGFLALFLGVLVSAIVYLICLMMFDVFDDGELTGIPFINFFEKLSHKLRFWENTK